MTTGEHPEPQRSVYDTCDPNYLRELREAAGMDWVVLARTACLSVAQVRQLETAGHHDLFYSDAIKRQAYKRLLMILGAEPPTVDVPDALRDVGKVAESHLATLDQIVAMSDQPAMNRSTLAVLTELGAKLAAHKQVLGALSLLVVAVTLFVLYGAQGPEAAPSVPQAIAPQTKTLAVSTPASVSVPVAALVPAPGPAASAAHVPVVVAPVKSEASLGACAFSQETMPQLTSLYAQKEGRYVYLVSGEATEVCVVDGQMQATTVQLKAGENRSVYGVAPWQVSSPNLHKIQIYFQGGRVSLPDAQTRRVKLVEVAVAR